MEDLHQELNRAFALPRPLYEDEKAFVGYISVLIRPELLFESIGECK